LIDGAYHVLFAVGQICDCRKINRLDFNVVKDIVPDAIRYVSELVETEQNRDTTFSFNRFFKDAKTKTKVASYIQQSEHDKNHMQQSA